MRIEPVPEPLPRCRAAVRNLGLAWPLARVTLEQRAITIDAPEVGKLLRKLGVRLPLRIKFEEIVGVRQSVDRTLEVRFAGAVERRELRADRRVDLWLSASDRDRLRAALDDAGIKISTYRDDPRLFG